MAEISSQAANKMQPLRQASHQVSASYLYLMQTGISGLLPLLAIPIITHMLPPQDYGVFVLAQVYALIATGMVNLGMAVGYERNFFLYEHSLGKSGALLYSVMAFVAANSILACSAVFFWRDGLSAMLFGTVSYGALLLMVFAGSALSSLTTYYLTYLKNSGRAVEYVVISTAQTACNFALLLLFLLHFNAGVEALAGAWLLSNAGVFLFVLFRLWHQLPFSLDKGMLADALRISLPLTPRVFFGFLNNQFDKMMLGMLASLGGVGVYGIGQKASYVVFQFMTALDRVFLPETYRRLFNGRENKGAAITSEYLLPFAYVSILVALLIVLFAAELFALLLPPTYAGGAEVAIVLSVYYAMLFFGKITGTQLIYAEKTHITSLLTLVGIAFNVLLNIPMILAWGALGAAWATLIAGVMSTILSYRVAQRYARVDWQWWPLGYIYGFFFLAGAFALYSLSHPWANPAAMFLAKLLFVIGYAYVGYRLGIVTRGHLGVLLSPAKGLRD